MLGSGLGLGLVTFAYGFGFLGFVVIFRFGLASFSYDWVGFRVLQFSEAFCR